MKHGIAIVLCCILFASVAAAQQAVNNPDPASKEQIAKIMEITKASTQVQTIMNSVQKQMSQMVSEEFKKQAPNAPPEMLAEMTNVMTDMTKELTASTGDLINDMVPVYEKYISRQEADAMIAFYSSPEGQSIMEKVPVMASEAMQLSMTKMRAKMDPIMERTNKRMQEIIKKYEPQASAPGKPKPEAGKTPVTTKAPAAK